jgi:hypothetical protein
MKAKLLALLAKLKGFLGQLKSSSILGSLQLKGLLIGLAAGYFGHPVLKLGVDAVLALVKGLLKI